MKTGHHIFKFLAIDTIPHDTECIRLNPHIRVRREYFGGLVYDTGNGNMLEVDKGVFQLLKMIDGRALKIDDIMTFLRERKIVKQSDRATGETLQRLFELHIIQKTDESQVSPALIPQESNEKGDKPWLSAPETVHWAVTYRCEEGCPDCYVARFPFIESELTTGDALRLIDTIAEWGVFQLAIGGGEPFARGDLPEIVRRAADRGLSVHLTTGMVDAGLMHCESLFPLIRNLQIGIKPERLLGADPERYTQQLSRFFEYAQRLGMEPGANVFLTRSVIGRMEDLVAMLTGIGFARITLLRYKPPESIRRWMCEHPEPLQMKVLHGRIGAIIRENPRLRIRVDCALGFLLRHLPKGMAIEHGIKGCVAADRILAVAPDGSVYPCSQLVHPRCSAGNLLDSEPGLLWNRAGILRAYRFFRTKGTFTRSWCGICSAQHACGGCRVFAADGLGGDPGCPEPLLPPLTQLGKTGRRLDLADYLRRYSTISVAEYMERYGVGQRKAVKELNASPCASSMTGRTARKKKDRFENATDVMIREIQDSIGYTSGGYPFASYEEISEWIEESSPTDDYPQWIKQ